MTIWLHAAPASSVCVLRGPSDQGQTFRWSSLERGCVKDAPSGECKLIYGPPTRNRSEHPGSQRHTGLPSEGSLVVRDC